MTKGIAAHLVDHLGIKVCSVCTQSFAVVSGPPLSVAFRKHVEENHSEKRQREEANQAAARVVKAGTE